MLVPEVNNEEERNLWNMKAVSLPMCPTVIETGIESWTHEENQLLRVAQEGFKLIIFGPGDSLMTHS